PGHVGPVDRRPGLPPGDAVGRTGAAAEPDAGGTVGHRLTDPDPARQRAAAPVAPEELMRRREPRAHWVLLFLFLVVLLAELSLNGYVRHIGGEGVGPAPVARGGAPAPVAVTGGHAIQRVAADGTVATSGVPDRTIALTFDDGPDPEWTPRILDVLARYGAHATFFEIGSRGHDPRGRRRCGGGDARFRRRPVADRRRAGGAAAPAAGAGVPLHHRLGGTRPARVAAGDLRPAAARAGAALGAAGRRMARRRADLAHAGRHHAVRAAADGAGGVRPRACAAGTAAGARTAAVPRPGVGDRARLQRGGQHR